MLKLFYMESFGKGDVYGTTRTVSSGSQQKFCLQTQESLYGLNHSRQWYKMFDSFMVSQILQEVSITIVFMVYSLSWRYMLCLLKVQAWLRSTGWLSWLGRLL